MIEHPFQTAVAFDLAAIFLFAITGALAGVRKHYDLVGVSVLALATALAGGLLRDIFLQRGTPVLLTDGRYLLAVLSGTAVVAVLRSHLHRLRLVILVLDALGLGIYGVVGAQKALVAGLPIMTALLLGTINAVGGGLVRDLLTGEEPDHLQARRVVRAVRGGWLRNLPRPRRECGHAAAARRSGRHPRRVLHSAAVNPPRLANRPAGG